MFIGPSRFRRTFVINPLLRRQSVATSDRFTITYTTPENQIPVTDTYTSFQSFQESWRGWRFLNPQTNLISSPTAFVHEPVDPTIVYQALHQLLDVRREQVSHHQIADKAFEEKSIKAIERYLHLYKDIQRRTAQNPARQDGWQFLTETRDIAEWGGIWEAADGHVFFLETKNFIDGRELVEIGEKLERSLEFLKISRTLATVYIAGKYWAGGQKTVNFARKFGFGVLEENGSDLEINEPHGVGMAAERVAGKLKVVEGGDRDVTGRA